MLIFSYFVKSIGEIELMVNRQFYIMKFSSSRLKKYKYDIKVTFNEAKQNKEIIAVSDSQMLRSIRDIRNTEIDKDYLEILIQNRDELKKYKTSKNSFKELVKIQSKIDSMLFIPDYITVVMDELSHYKYIYKNGVKINGKTYKRLSCSAGQARVSTVVLCNTEIIDELEKRLNNDRDLTKKLAPSKFNAYFGLSSSATKKVSDPKFIVVKDFSNTTKFKTNFVTETDWDYDDIVTKKEIEQEMNRTDGMGLISPKQAKKWAKELGLNWIPAQFCIRQSFIKGMLCTFDIHQFCKEVNNGNYVVDTIYKDENGEYIKADLRDYDVIISESQFKLWDSYKNVDEYIEACHRNKLYWGVSQYTPKKAKNTLKLNYQFIQTLNLDEKDIEELCSQFVNWIDGVTYNNIAYTLLFLLGVNNDENKIKHYLQNSDNYWIKGLIANPDIKNDKYIRNKILSLIRVQMQNGCLGSIYVDGNFQVLVSDPYGFMQHVCGLEVTGLLKKDEFYSNYWNERGITQVDSMRSPMTYRSEHVILNLRNDDEVNKWYKYCYVGIILNYHGHEVVQYAGADKFICLETLLIKAEM